MGLSELAGKLSKYETVSIPSLGVDVRIKHLTIGELQQAEKLMDECSIGSGKNRKVGRLDRLVFQLVKRYFTDADGEPLAGEDTEEEAAEWPSSLVTELLTEFKKVNAPGDDDPN